MSESFDVEQARDELIGIEEQIEEKNETVENFIFKIKGRFITFTYEGVDIRVKGAVPHSVKERAFDLKRRRRELEEDDLESLDEVLQPTYEILADICLDDPWNRKSTWEHIEKETGASDVILGKILEEIAEADKQVGKFRKKR
jgi:hypothetical protein